MTEVTKVGEILSSNQPRDAIHIAVAAVVATEVLEPGQNIGFVEGAEHDHKTDVAACERAMSVGIVDPFLTDKIMPGQWFWMFLHPYTITSLRHNWTHPAFGESSYEDDARKHTSERWLRDFLSNEGPSYENLIAAVNNGGEWVDPSGDDYYGVSIDGNYIHVGGSDAHGEVPSEFWDHVENVVGRKVPFRASSFSCSC